MKRSLHCIFLFLFAACSNYAQVGTEVAPEEFEKGIARAGVQVLDCRTAGEFRSGHLTGALQADWTDKAQFMDRTRHLDKSKPVYVYCLSGGRSGAAADYLRTEGFTEVVNLKGGLSSWKKTGRTLVNPSAGKQETPPDQYDALANSAPVVLVDFGAEWCPPCKKMEPVLDAFLKEQGNPVKMIKMDGGVENQLMKRHNVEGLPTFIVYKNGKEAARKQGVMSAEELRALTR